MRCLNAFLLLLAALILPWPAAAEEERILSFVSDIAVYEDGSLIVTETIEVMALGREIKRGILREIPVTYRSTLGRPFHVGFEILEVIGVGGMGLVLCARDPSCARRVAIKLLKPEWVSQPRAVHRFLVAARQVQRMSAVGRPRPSPGDGARAEFWRGVRRSLRGGRSR